MSDESTRTIAELKSFLRACEEQVGTEGYSRPRFRALFAVLIALEHRGLEPVDLAEGRVNLSKPATE